MEDFLKEVNGYAAQIKNHPDKYGVDAPFSGFEVDRVMVRRFSKIARISFAGVNSEKISFYVKKSVPNSYLGETEDEIRKRVINEYGETEKIFNDLKGVSGIFTPCPAGIFPGPIVYIIKECPGTPLSSHIDENCKLWHSREKREPLRKNLFNVGRALKVFHNRDSTGGMPELDWAEMESYWLVRLEKIVKTNPLFKEPLAKQVMDFLKEMQKLVVRDELKQTLSHCDFNPGNILISDSGVSILDFARIAPFSPFLDITHLCHHLNNIAYKPYFSNRAMTELVDAFLEGYGDRGLKTQTIYKLFMVQNRLCQLVYLSRSGEHSFKSRLYNRYVISKSIDWLKQEAIPE